MGLLSGKKAVIFGIANERSIAWGIAKAFHEQGAELGFSYAGEVIEKRIKPLAESIGVDFVEPCDVGLDADIDTVVRKAKDAFGEIDILVHSIGYAFKEELEGPYFNTSREGFKTAMDISVYSFTALAKGFSPLFRPGGSLLTLTYYGAEKVAPNYNVMGVAKAALEASVRYLAYDLGPHGVRVNAISAGPIRTLAAAGVSSFKEMYRHYSELVPMRENIDTEDIGKTALYLCSDMSSRVTGEVVHVDSGYNILGFPIAPCD